VGVDIWGGELVPTSQLIWPMATMGDSAGGQLGSGGALRSVEMRGTYGGHLVFLVDSADKSNAGVVGRREAHCLCAAGRAVRPCVASEPGSRSSRTSGNARVRVCGKGLQFLSNERMAARGGCSGSSMTARHTRPHFSRPRVSRACQLVEGKLMCRCLLGRKP